MDIVLIVLGVLVGLVFLGWLGLQIKPKSFPNYPQRTPGLESMPLPPGLPGPVERFFRTVYGDSIPVIQTAVVTGRAIIRPFMNIPFPARFVFVHRAGKDYRHYIEATWFGLPLMKVNERYVGGKSLFELPFGTLENDPNTNQGAILGLWSETGWFPAVWASDPRTRWLGVDANTAVLYVPFEGGEENFVVRFDPKTGLVDRMEAMRFRGAGDAEKILWITHNLPGRNLPGSKVSAVGDATWLDQGKPWATFFVEDIVYNVDVESYILQKGA